MAQVPRAEKRMVDALANLASSAIYPCHVELSIMDQPSIHNAAVLTVENQDGDSWISPILSYLKNETFPEDKSEAMKVKARAAKYTLINNILYRRLFSSPYQRFVPSDE